MAEGAAPDGALRRVRIGKTVLRSVTPDKTVFSYARKFV